MKGYERPNDQHRQRVPCNLRGNGTKVTAGIPPVLAAKSTLAQAKSGVTLSLAPCLIVFTESLTILSQAYISLQGTTVQRLESE